VVRVLLLIAGTIVASYGSWRALVRVDIKRGAESGGGEQSRFLLVDFFALFVTLQVPLLLVTTAVRIAAVPRGTLLFWGGLYSLVYVGIWWWGVGALSAAQVVSSLRRAVFLGVLQPVGVLLSFAIFYLAFGGPFFILTGSMREAWFAFAGLMGAGVAAWLYSLACDWIRAGGAHAESQTMAENREHAP
jgi:hypothetical protein